jgi:NADH:ubiquinone oxidoreductase subunit D
MTRELEAKVRLLEEAFEARADEWQRIALQNNELREDKKMLKQEVEHLRVEVKRMWAENQKYINENERLREERDQWEAAYTGMRIEKERLEDRR